MPKKYICSAPGCKTLLDERGYCPKHKREKPDWRDAKKKPFASAQRYNTELYNTVRWQKLRQDILERDGFRCSKCGELFAAGLQVHHLVPPRGDEELFFAASNLILICASCHRIETGKEIRERKS
jgi:5-methylcytosine-specific restriction endonuclease McrA